MIKSILLLFGFGLVSPPASGQTGPAMAKFYEDSKASGFSTKAVGQAFDQAFSTSLEGSVKEASANFAKGQDYYTKNNPTKKGSSSNGLASKEGDKTKTAPTPPETAPGDLESVRGSSVKRDTDTGMASGSEGGAQIVTFGSGAAIPEPATSPAAKQKPKAPAISTPPAPPKRKP